MSFNLTTDDVWDERESMGLNKEIKRKEDSLKTIIDDKGNEIFKGRRIERMMFLKKHFNWTNKMLKRGRWQKYIKDVGYKIEHKNIINYGK